MISVVSISQVYRVDPRAGVVCVAEMVLGGVQAGEYGSLGAQGYSRAMPPRPAR
jgi:hypothetical protein